MSVTERILRGIRELLRQQDKIEALTDAVKDLTMEVREMDRRLARLEGMVELASRQAGARRLPSSKKR